MNYDKLLDDWAEKCNDEARDCLNKKYPNIDLEKHPFKAGYSKGYAEGLFAATTYLNMMEKKIKAYEETCLDEKEYQK